MAKALYIKTYGCQMNVYDSDRMADLLAPLGYRPVAEPDAADMVILNTCHIREKAAEKVYSDLGRLRPLQQRRRAGGDDMIIAVAGCVAQAEGEVMLDRAPFVDLMVGPQTYHRLPEMLARIQRAGGRQPGRGLLDTAFPAEDKFDRLPEATAGASLSAFLSIQEGCDKFCTFCVVPYTRGAEVSRPVQQVLSEARRFADLGTREVTLLGQNVNAYHGIGPDGAEWGLGRLIRALAAIEGIERIRYTTSHPRDVDADLIAAHGSVDKLMPYLHLPVQSGSDRVLAAMNRRHSAADYERLVDRLRTARPDLALSSDFIVGFPGETAADFDATMALVDRIGFAGAFSFKFSIRPGTPAADLPQVPEPDKAARLTALQALLTAQQTRFNAATVGTVQPVLIEKPGRHAGQVVGRSPYLQPVHLTGTAAMIGRILPVRIDATAPNSLSGTTLSAAASGPSGGASGGPALEPLSA